MLISSSQPYFAPYAGFWQKMLLSDVMIILDNVQFPLGSSWITRNRFKNDQGVLLLSIPVWQKGLGLQNIDQVRICHEGRWHGKYLVSIGTAYAHAPYLEEHWDFVKRILSPGHIYILQLNMEILEYIKSYLQIQTKLIQLSELGLSSHGQDLLPEACNQLQAEDYLAQSSARKYLDAEDFKQKGVRLHFFRPESPVYPQLWGDFIPNLSILDMIFNCGRKTIELIQGPLQGRRPSWTSTIE